MRTADFLFEQALAMHMERRRTPRRAFILCCFAVLCLALSQGVAWSSQDLQSSALEAEQPDEDALVAGARLNNVYREMSAYANRLDPLCQHLAAPTSGWLLAGIAAAAGKDVIIEKVAWEYDGEHMNKFAQPEPRLILTVTAVIHGDDALLALPKKLREFTGYARARTGKVEVVSGQVDALRVELELDGANSLLNLPGAIQ